MYLSFFELMNVSSASLADSMPERIVEVIKKPARPEARLPRGSLRRSLQAPP